MTNFYDEAGDAYVSLMVSKIPHDPWDIYGYLDAPSGERTTPIDRNTTIYLYTPMPEITPRTVAEIHQEAARYEEDMLQKTKEMPGNQRADFLYTHMRSLRVRTAMLLGEKFSYDDMVKGLYDLTAPHYEEADFQKALDDLKAVIPGTGPLYDRIDAFREKITVPANRLAATMTAAIEEFHRISVANMDINPDSAPRLSFYGFGPHRAGLELDGYVYDWDLDRINWEIVFSTEHKFVADDLISFACHEMEPGHLTFIGLRTKAAYTTACHELAIVPQFSPSSAFIEGGARFGIDLCLPGEDLYAFEKELLFPLAGIDPGLIECMPMWHNYRKQVNYAKHDLDRRMWDGDISDAEATAFMQKYCLAPQNECADAIHHLAADAGHFAAHDYSRDVITRYIRKQAKTLPEQWALYRELSMAHISMSGIEDNTYRIIG